MNLADRKNALVDPQEFMDEFEIIQRYFAGPITFHHDGIRIGPGDDCAVVRVPAGFELCVSTDTLLEGVHFPSAADGAVVACRALAANLSDLAAMGAESYGFTLALTFPEYSDDWLSSFSHQLNKMVEQYQIPLIGGNLSRGPLSLTVNIMGQVPEGDSILRSGAQHNDLVFVSGYLGDAAAGLASVLGKQDALGIDLLIGKYLFPEPRLSLGVKLRNIATAAIDVSDGLAADLGHICQQSLVQATIRTADLALSDQLVKQVGRAKAAHMALTGGDDYELCFTAPAQAKQLLQRLAVAESLPLTCIGKVVSRPDNPGVQVLNAQGEEINWGSGYQHFG